MKPLPATSSKPAAEQAYMFRHVLVRDAAYQLQMPRQRAELHGLALRIMEGLFPDDLPALALELANHARDAQVKGTASRRKLIEVEARYLALAVNFARASFNNQGALEIAKRLSLLPTKPEFQFAANLNLAELHEQAGRAPEALPYADQALAFARTSAKRKEEARALLVVAHCHRLVGKFAEGSAVALEALRSADAVGDDSLRARCLGALASVAFQTGSMDTALKYVNQGAVLARKLGHDNLLANTLLRLGGVSLTLNKLDEADAYFTEGEQVALRVGDKVTIAGIISNRGLLERRRRNYAGALKHYLDAEALHTELGALEGIMQNLGNRGTLHRLLGDHEAALECYARAGAVALSTGNDTVLSMNAAYRGMIEYERGNYEIALTYYAQAEEIMRRIGQPQNLVPVLLRRAMAQRRLGLLYPALQSMIESNLLDAQTTQSANEAANLHAEAEILVAMGALDAAFERAKASLKNAAAEELGDDHEFPCQALMVLARVAYARGNQPEYIRLRAEVERRMALIAPTQTQAVSDLAFAYSQLPPKAN